LIVAYRNGSAVRLSDVAEVVDAPETLRAAGYSNGKPSVLLVIFRQPGANIIDTVDRVRAMLPQLKADIPRGHPDASGHGSDPDHPRLREMMWSGP
jgi:multidrug efflux pump